MRTPRSTKRSSKALSKGRGVKKSKATTTHSKNSTKKEYHDQIRVSITCCLPGEYLWYGFGGVRLRRRVAQMWTNQFAILVIYLLTPLFETSSSHNPPYEYTEQTEIRSPKRKSLKKDLLVLTSRGSTITILKSKSYILSLSDRL